MVLKRDRFYKIKKIKNMEKGINWLSNCKIGKMDQKIPLNPPYKGT
jgi:hypothetical protein